MTIYPGMRRYVAALGAAMGSSALALSVSLGTGMLAEPAMAQDAALSFDIPAQDLNRALLSFGNRAGVQVAYDTAGVRGLRSTGVAGSLTPSEALSRMLSGTGVGYRFTGPRSVALILPQAGAGQGAANADGAIVLDRVTITAGGAGVTEGTNSYTTGEASSSTGLALSIRETPQSVSVVTEQRIRDQALSSTKDVLNYTTGVSSVTSETDRDSTVARGFWIGNYIVDGVSLPTYEGWYSGVSLSSSTAVYDRVEVLRGAAGLLSGSGDPGAAVSITRKRANATQTEGSMELRYGSWANFGGTVDIGTPLTADGSVRGRFIMDAASSDSYIDRYHVNRQTYYGAIDADLTPSTKLSFSLEHRRHDPTASMWGELPALDSNGNIINYPRNFSHAPDWAYWASKQTSVVGKLEHEFDNGWQAEATLGATFRRYDAELLYIYGNPDPVTGEGLGASAWGGTERTRLISFDAKANGPVELLGRTHQLNFGVSTDRDWIKRDWPGYSGELEPIGNFFDWDGSYPRPDWNPKSNPDWDSNRRKTSAYASGQFSITDPLTLILGARYTDWRSELGDDDRKFSEVTPYAGLVYDVNDEWSLYASYTDIFNPQNYRDRNGAYLDPVIGKSYELGAKAELFDGGLNATVAVFDTQQDNVAVRDGILMVPGGDNEYAYRGSKGIRSKGVELEFSGEVRPGWNVFLGASAIRLRNAEGERYSTEQPTRSIKISTSYDLPGKWEQWTVGGGLRWQNDSWTDVQMGGENYRVQQDSYAVVDVMARYEINDQWSAQLNVNNLFDKSYYNTPYDQITYGQPRNALLTLVSRF